MMTNVRKPDLNLGDLKAFVGAMNTGERKVREHDRQVRRRHAARRV